MLHVIKKVLGILFATISAGIFVKFIFDLVEYRFFAIKGWTPYVWLWTKGYDNLIIYGGVIITLSLLSWRMFYENRARN